MVPEVIACNCGISSMAEIVYWAIIMCWPTTLITGSFPVKLCLSFYSSDHMSELTLMGMCITE